MTFTTVNSQPRPRALFQDLPSEIVDAVSPLFPTFEVVGRDDPVHEEEFDVLIAASIPFHPARHLHVITFGVVPSVEPAASERRYVVLRLAGETFARELRIPESVEPGLRDLINRDLIPWFAELHPKPTVVLANQFSGLQGHGPEFLPAIDAVEPFLVAGSSDVLAGRCSQWSEDGEQAGRIWFLPIEVHDYAAWVRAALREFHEIDPVRVPALPEWWSTGPWRTPAQMVADRDLREAATERARVTAALDEAVQQAQDRYQSATDQSLAGPLRLLTESGTALEDEVGRVLETFGFDVRDMDGVYPAGDRREDFQLRLPSGEDWVSLVEVKGYTRGAAVNDLARVERWATRYTAEHGRIPSAKWHIVNVFRLEDPETRPQALPNDDDIRDFADHGGLLIDTRDLFRAWVAVDEGSSTAEAVRSSLLAANGRWRFLPAN